MLHKWIKWAALAFLVYVVAVGDFNLNTFRHTPKTSPREDQAAPNQSLPAKEGSVLERTINKYIEPSLQEKLKSSKTRKEAVETLSHQLLGKQLMQTSKPYSDLKPGAGKPVYCGQEVTVHYLAKLLDGTPIENTRKSGKPVTFVTGEGKVLPGVDSYVVGMQKGGLRKMFLPSNMAYGAEGFTKPGVAPGLIVQVEAELLETEGSPFDLGTVQVFKKAQGTGELALACRDVASVHLKIRTIEGKELLDTTREQKPFTFQIGQGDTPFGLEQSVIDMKLGEGKTLIIPPALLKSRQGKALKELPRFSGLPDGQSLIVDVDVTSIYKHYQ